MEHEQSGRVRPYFSDFPLQVLARPRDGGGFDVSGDMNGDDETVGCYANSVTALVDAIQMERAGRPGFGCGDAGTFDRHLFHSRDGKSLIANVRIGWPVHRRKIILRPGLGFATITKRLRQRVPDDGAPLSFEVDEDAFAWLDAIHERAGLYAWRETARAALSWNADRMTKAALRALESIEVTVCDASRCDEVALFDPESEQWHFVPAKEFLIR
ncbi:hypothetical protein LMG27952_01976 [Paraburkholderia hiiakae]|uniref:Uncharacterized protein n=1 Tax=Paraburkholderia hiiakae TaxID=1081782 RepID=A0ABM8NI27_9BURK|nr:hypothetical protein LMG27952_01976 [Paraburkholderia hiiakae]